MKFRLLPKVGDHAEAGPAGEALTYTAGDIVESDRDLVEAFPAKFELVEELKVNPFKPTAEEKSDVQKAAEKGAQDILPQLKKGSPVTMVGHDNPGKVFKVFKNGKVQVKLFDGSMVTFSPEDVTLTQEEPEEENPLGRDVTKRFPKAVEEDFLVFADGGAFSVVEADEPTEGLNDKPLKRKDVDPFIRKYLEG